LFSKKIALLTESTQNVHSHKPKEVTQRTDNLTKFANDSVDSFANFMFTQMFKAAAPENVRRLLSHKDQTRLAMEDAYKVFFTDHRLEMDKKASQVHVVSEEQDFSNLEQQQDIASFRPQQRQQNRPQQNLNNRGNN
jgi:hypothetical protein